MDDPQDRRRVIVAPVESPAAQAAVLRYFVPLAEATAEEVLARYSDAELAVIVDFVKRGADLMKAQTARVLQER
jgi:DNA-binding MarR family transcriptional regulator